MTYTMHFVIIVCHNTKFVIIAHPFPTSWRFPHVLAFILYYAPTTHRRRLIDAVKQVITIALIIAGCSYIFLNAIN